MWKTAENLEVERVFMGSRHKENCDLETLVKSLGVHHDVTVGERIFFYK
jgi:hypothetical protein